jgi:hypothetical protein
MAPTESVLGLKRPGTTTLIVIVAVAVLVWMFLSNMPPAPPKEQPRVIKINATPPPPPPQPQQPQPQSTVELFMCRGEAYRTRSGIMICGVEMVTDQYVLIRRGWIYAPNSTQFMLLGDVPTCRFSVGINTLYVNCTSYIMVMKQ